MIVKPNRLMKGAMPLALFASPAAQNLYLLTNPVAVLEAWREKKAALRRKVVGRVAKEADSVIRLV